MDLAMEDMDLVMKDMDFVVKDVYFVVEDNRLVENYIFFFVEDNHLFGYIVDNHHEVNIILIEDLVLILVDHLYFKNFWIFEVLFQLEQN